MFGSGPRSKQFSFRFFLAFTVLLISSTGALAQTFTDDRFSVETLTTLPPFKPVGIAWAPDGRAFIWQKDGIIKMLKGGTLLSTNVLDIRSKVNSDGDRGLIGFALDPSFSTNHYFYVGYVYEGSATDLDGNTPRTERVTRFQMDPANPDRALASSETVIVGKVSDPNCNRGTQDCMTSLRGEHTIDHLMFGKDGKLYISLGDGASSSGTNALSFNAQNVDYLNGKLLRVNKDGTGPSDNPFYNGNPSANRSKVYDMGLRNPYRFTIHPSTGEVYIGDVGWFQWEEINRGKGHNFGWPCYEGAIDSDGDPFNKEMSRYQSDFPSKCDAVSASSVTPPSWAYPHISGGDGASITMGTFYTGTIYPTSYQGKLFFSDYVNSFIKYATLNSDGSIASVHDFATNVGGPVYLTQGPDQNLYYIDIITGSIHRIKFAGGNRAPIAKASANPTTGYPPLSVNFSSAGTSDADGDTLTYHWDFGDGTTSTSQNPIHQYTEAGVHTYAATLTVKDPDNAEGTATVNITVGSTAPTATITSPQSGKVQVGDVVNFTGTATDPDDGTLPSSSLRWDVFLHHNGHLHTVIADLVGSGGSFTVEDHDPVGFFSYEVILTATDSSGLTNKKSVMLDIDRPDTGTCELPASSGDVNICSPLNGSTVTSPVTINASGGTAVTRLDAWIDGVKTQGVDGNMLTFSKSLANGSHRLTIIAKSSGTETARKTINFAVGSTSGGGGCTPSSAGDVLICSPTDGSTVSSPVAISAKGGSSVNLLEAWVDGVKRQSSSSNSLSFSLDLSAGSHRLVVIGKSSGTETDRQVINFNVGSSGGTGGCTPSSAGDVLICAPTDGSTVSSPVAISAKGGSSVNLLEAWVDGVKRQSSSSNSLSFSLDLSAGSHRLVVIGKSSGTETDRQVINFNVSSSGSSSGCTPASAGDVLICSPTDGSTVSSPVTISAKGGSSVTSLEAWVDGVKRQSSSSNSLSFSMTLSSGSHRLVVIGKSSGTETDRQIINFNVS
jgi:glucose/arabinose dehydrogenase